MWIFAEWQNVITSELNKEIADLTCKMSRLANVRVIFVSFQKVSEVEGTRGVFTTL